LLDRKQDLLDNLEQLRSSYLRLIILKQHEHDACDHGAYEILHELAENERILVDDINSIMKYIVPDLLFFREDSEIKKLVAGLDRLQASVIRRNLSLREDLKERIEITRKSLENLKLFSSPANQHPGIVNLRA
jgi:hypothetical protein